MAIRNGIIENVRNLVSLLDGRILPDIDDRQRIGLAKLQAVMILGKLLRLDGQIGPAGFPSTSGEGAVANHGR